MPVSGAEASYGDLLLTSLLVLGGVCVAAFIVVRVVGRWVATGRVRGGHLLDVVARVPLEPRRSLYVVEVAGKTLLVGTSEMGLSVLSELDAGEVRTRMATPSKVTFADLVRGAWNRRRAARDPLAAGHDSGSSARDRDGSGDGTEGSTVRGRGGEPDGGAATGRSGVGDRAELDGSHRGGGARGVDSDRADLDGSARGAVGGGSDGSTRGGARDDFGGRGGAGQDGDRAVPGETGGRGGRGAAEG